MVKEGQRRGYSSVYLCKQQPHHKYSINSIFRLFQRAEEIPSRRPFKIVQTSRLLENRSRTTTSRISPSGWSGVNFLVHRLDLAQESPVFTKMLLPHTKDSTDKCVEVPDTEPNDMLRFLTAMYHKIGMEQYWEDREYVFLVVGFSTSEIIILIIYTILYSFA